jgi:hypothetical protein
VIVEVSAIDPFAPYVGAVVVYVLDGGLNDGQLRVAAIEVVVDEGTRRSDLYIRLQTTDVGVYLADQDNVPWDQDNDTPGTWHWPRRS